MARRTPRISRTRRTERRDMICGCSLIAVSALSLAGFFYVQAIPHMQNGPALIAAATAGGMLLVGAVSAVLASLD